MTVNPTDGPAGPPRGETLVEVLGRRARETPERRVFTFLQDGEEEEASLDFAGLDRRARAIAVALAAVARPGDRALLLFPPGLDFVTSFFGCLYAGVIAVPAYPPRSKRMLPRLASMLDDSEPAVILAPEDELPRLEAWFDDDSPRIPWLATDTVDPSAADTWRRPAEVTPDHLAFLQYTSGSTSAPKGVMVSHRNLLHNQGVIRDACDHRPESVFVSWLPVYHDLGLIGQVLQAVYVGCHAVNMAPVAFLQRPLRWLEAISRYRATTSGGPNFAYDLAVARSAGADLDALDLSSWRVAFNGAEPVRSGTLERFARTYARSGFDARASYPCYGLAEATLMVTGGASPAADSGVGEAPVVVPFDVDQLAAGRAVAAADDDGVRELVGSGRPLSDWTVRVVEPESRKLRPEGVVGEIWIASDSVAQGYWGKPDVSEETFRARLMEDDGRCYLRTGDLGFFHRGELFVAGRLKDLIILRGRNLYPQDLEATAEASHPDLRPGGVIAFSVEAAAGDGTTEERLVIVQEIHRRPEAEPDEIAAAVRQAVAAEHEVQVHDVVLVRPGGVPKTTSGKVQRSRGRALYLAGELPVVLSSRPAEPELPGSLPQAPPAGSVRRAVLAAGAVPARRELVAEYLRATVARVARIDPERLDPDEPLTRYGLDSLGAIELKNAVEAELGVAPSISRLLEGVSLAAAADELAPRVVERDGGGPGLVSDGVTPGAPRPLSAGQRSLWFLHRLAPESAAYSIAGAARLPEGIDRDRLARAVEVLSERHPVLRSVYRSSPDGPVQVVLPVAEAPPVFEVLEPEDPGADDPGLVARLSQIAFRPFDLERGPVWRVALVVHHGATHLVLAVHHVAADLTSLAILARELGALYGGGDPGPAPELAYTDFVRWQRRLLDSPRGDELTRYWTGLLDDVPALELPFDRPRPARQSFQGATRTRVLPGLAGRLAAVGRRLGEGSAEATLFAVLAAGTQLFLGRLAGQSRFALGTPTTGRWAQGFADVVGYFVDTLALPVDLSGEPTATRVVERTHRQLLGAFDHAEMPFSVLAERLRPERHPARPPVVQTLLVLQKSPVPELSALAAFSVGAGDARLELGPGLTLESVPLERPGAQLDLSVLAADDDGDLHLGLELDTALFDAATGERWLGHLAVLLDALAAAPETPAHRLPMLTAAEERQILVLGGAATPAPADEPPNLFALFALFAVGAAGSAEAVAVESGQGDDAVTLTYGELAARVEELAQRLEALGIGPESPVGLALGRGPEQIVAFLAIHRTGAAVLPLDPELPVERRRAMVHEARPAVVLVPEDAAREDGGDGSLGAHRVLTVGPIAPDGERRHRPSPDRPVATGSSPAGPDHLAYVLYTSGSTGRPKGVCGTHRGAVRRVLAAQEAFALTAQDRLLQISPLGFDFALWEIFGPLMVGARLVLLAPGAHRDPAALVAAIGGHGITQAHFVPSMLDVLLGEPELAAAGASLARVYVGGEALSRGLAERFFDTLPGVPLENQYGPTEASVDLVWHTPRPGDTGPVPIGRPIAGTRAHLVDARLQPVPPGVAGEIVLGGVGLARGYLGRPALTAERFLPDPFASATGEPGGRLYRTGDLGRLRPTAETGGEIEILGRVDAQVKVRGVRVEPGEVESALAAHRQIREVAVVARGDGAGRHLVAFVVPVDPAEPPAATALRDHCLERLPQAFVPSRFVALEALPRTASDKIDRRALPETVAGDGLGTSSSPGAARPAGATADLVAGIWATLLGGPAGAPTIELGADSHFFALGGHSLLATQVTARLRRALEVEVPVAELFEHPTLEAFAARVDELAGLGATREEAIVPVDRRQLGGLLPVTPAQESLWFLSQLDPESPAYNVPAALEMRGVPDLPALQRALATVVARHEVLRSRFRSVGGRPVQEPLPPGAVETALPVIDLAALPDDRRRGEALALARAEAVRPFRLGEDRPLRLRVVRRAPSEHLLLATFHHFVADGWSLGVFLGELTAGYGAYRRGEIPDLPALPVQVGDVADHLQRRLAGGGLDASVAWWRQRLDGFPLRLDLPADRPRPPVQEVAGGSVPVAVDRATVEVLETIGRRRGATPFGVWLAVWALLVHRLAGRDRLVLGAPSAGAGRDRVETEGLIGHFVNLLPLPLDLSGDPTFGELLERVAETTLGATAHGAVPFERLVEEIAPERDPSAPPLVQVVFALQNAPAPPLALPGLELTLLDEGDGLARQTAKFDLTLELEPADGGGPLTGRLEYARSLFDAATAAAWGERFAHLARELAADPARRLSEVPLVLPREAERLARWSRGPTPADTADVPSLVLRRADERPEAVAVEGPGGLLTYGELAERARRLAGVLEGHGAGPERLVALWTGRSPETVVGALAAWLTGAAYLPLDPATPPDRLTFLLQDAGAVAVVTTDELAGGLPAGAWAVVRVSDGSQAAAFEGHRQPSPDGLAYVIYTSGSTGVPKGVELAHRGLAHLVAWHRRAFGLGPDDLTTMIAGPGFDASVWEIWPTLAAGASLWVPPTGTVTEPKRLAEEIVRRGVRVAFLPTPLAEASLGALATAAGDGDGRFQLLLTGGDRLHEPPPPGLPFTLVNDYGPTEATVVTTSTPVAADDPAPPPIGGPIDGLSTHVVDARLRPVPPGVPGELLVGGVGLARGYRGRPALTAAAFVPDGLGGPGAPGRRLYRTGDLVRWRADGRLDFLGRLDDQVKVRGLRVEIGEIETRLARLDGVADAAVVVVGEGSMARLVAFVEGASGGEGVDSLGLAEALGQELPGWMVPGAFVAVDRLPVTANGKVDRAALVERAATAVAGGGASKVPPRTPMEELVAGVFAGVLGVDAVGAHDGFFQLGGHSLAATRAVGRLREITGLGEDELGLSALFEQPDVAGLARRIERATALAGSAQATGEPPLVAGLGAAERERRGDGLLPLAPAQERLWLVEHLEGGSPLYTIAAPVAIRGRLDRAALAAALAAVVHRHPVLRTVVVEDDGVPLQRTAPAGPVPLPVVDLAALGGPAARRREIERLTRDDAQRPFDLRRSPLRATLVTPGPGGRDGAPDADHLLLLAVHHLVADGWSMGLLLDDLGAAYEAPGELPPSAADRPDYDDVVVWQRRRLEAGAHGRDLAWWRQRLAGLPPLLALPTDRPRPPVAGRAGGAEPLRLPAALVAALSELTEELGSTPFMALVGLVQALLSRWSGARRVPVGTPVAGRGRPETESLVGLFVDTLVLDGDLAPLHAGDRFAVRDLLAASRATALAAFAHQGVPFERLVEALDPRRSRAHGPLVQVLVSFQNAPMGPLALPGLELELLERPETLAQLDLTFVFRPDPATGELAGRIEYRRDLFDRATVRRLAAALVALVTAAVEDPDAAVASLPLAGLPERSEPLALPATAEVEEDTPGAPRAAADVEAAVVGLWRELLELSPPVDLEPTADFFTLGGQSLLAARLVSRLRRRFAVDLPAAVVFDHPTLAGLAAAVERARGASGAGSARPVATPLPRPGSGPWELPLAPAQERLWFLWRLEPASAAYTMPAAFEIDGPLDRPALARALARVTARHEILRTTFGTTDDGSPVQVIAPGATVALPVVDLTGLQSRRADRETRRLARADALAPFDLARGPVARFTLVALPAGGAARHALLASFHHIAADGASVDVFGRELAAFYGEQVAGAPAQLPQLPVQVADVGAADRAWLDSGVARRQLDWWKATLDGLADEPLELPFDRPRPPVRSFRGGAVPVTLAPQRVAALRALADSRGATLFMALLAVLHALLGRLADHPRPAVATPVAGRDRPETEGLVGFFVDTVILRGDLVGGSIPFDDLLTRTRRLVLDAFAHREVPFERLVAELEPARDLSRAALYQVLLTLQDERRRTPPSLPGLAVRDLDSQVETAKVDLTLSLAEGPGGEVAGFLQFDRDLFDRATAERIAGWFETLVDAVGEAPSTPLARLSYLAPAERRALLAAASGGAAPEGAPEPATVSELFALRVAAAPDAPAVRAEDGALTAAELAAGADRLARRLDVGLETPVALLVPASTRLIVGLLGILQTGATAVPLDPDAPPERLAFQLADAGCRVLVTDGETASRFPELVAAVEAAVEIDAAAAAPKTVSAVPPVPESAAYVVYTSGSTGRPKGVVVEHRQIAAYARAVTERLELDPRGLSFATVTPLAADLGHTSVFVALVGGGEVVVVSREGSTDREALVELFAQRPVDVLKIVPSHLAALLGEPGDEPDKVLPRRLLVTGGEALGQPLVDRLAAALPAGAEIANHYGPSETTVGVAAGRLSADDLRHSPTRSATAPLGRPLPGVALHVVDRWLRPVGTGVAGELVVGGGQVSRGYLGRPGATAAVFVPDPFSQSDGSRLYRTGDRVRRLADGRLEFLGRFDDQVKIRGQRVEPGEVAAALAREAGVAEAFVLPRDGELVAYLVPAHGAGEPDTAALAATLSRRLPDAFVPRHFVLLDRLPLTANGKVDRRALPAPPVGDATPQGRQPPATPTERRLAALWADLLDLPVGSIGRRDDFFRLGGHSLLATRLLTRLRREMPTLVHGDRDGRSLPLRALFEQPTVAGLAGRIDALVAGDGGEPWGPVERTPGEPVPASWAQERIWFLDRLAPTVPSYNLPYFVDLAGPLDRPALARAFAATVTRHEALRTRLPERDGHPVQVVEPPPGEARLPVVDLATLGAGAGRELDRLTTAQARRPFDLARGPLVRWLVVAESATRHRLLLTLHHAVSDASSRRILAEELDVLYRAFTAGAATLEDALALLPPAPLQAPDVALHQRRELSGERLEELVAWWRRALPPTAPLELPTDRPRPAGEIATPPPAGVETVRLGSELTAAVARLARSLGTTPFVVLLAGFQAVLARWSGHPDRIAVGSAVAGRDRPELARSVGFYVNTLVLATRLGDDPPFERLVERLGDVSRGAQAHQELPFERLVTALAPERRLSRTPLFEVMVSFQNRGEDGGDGPRLADLAVTPVEVASGRAKFDLTLSLVESRQGIAGSLEYRRDLWDPETATRWVDQLARLLAGAVERPEERLSELPLLSEPERRLLLDDWAHGARPDLGDGDLFALFARWAAEHPDAPALVFERDGALEEWSYGELAALASRVARRLAPRMDAVRETPVALLAERSPELVAAILGVLEAGGFYVPLDPSHPAERLAFLIDDVGAALVVTDGAGPGVDLTPDVSMLSLDQLTADDSPLPEADPAPRAAMADRLAYVMYTSGSTGVPKGVATPHRAVVRLVTGAEAFPVGPAETYLLLAPVSFDAATLEIWGALATGGRLAVMPAGASSLDDIGRALDRFGVTVLWLTAGLFHQMVELRVEALAPVRCLLAGGDVLAPAAVARALEHLPDTVLVNGYGPTENTTFTTCHPMAAPPQVGRPVSVGRPIASTRVHVVDARLDLVPRGVWGELVTGGAGLARGYLGRPALTAERFMPDPFSATGPGSRLYRTGDLVRWRPDGRLEFRGRADAQVKLRGHRVELGEIEAALAADPRVTAAAAVVAGRGEAAGEERLVAFVVPAVVAGPDEAQDALGASLLEGLARRLPGPLVPSAIHSLDALPLTANGKLDRRRLATLAAERAARSATASGTAAAPVATPTEELVAGLMADLLELPGGAVVGRQGDFFDLGGHSLLATRLVSRLRTDLGAELPLAAVFENPTVVALAAVVDAARKGAGPIVSMPPLVALPAAERRRGLPLSFAQERLWFLDRLEGGAATYVIPAVLHIRGALDLPALMAAFDRVVERHESLRTTFAETDDGTPEQRVSDRPPRVWTVVDLTGVDRRTADQGLLRGLARRFLARPFDLARGPVVRLQVARLAADEHRVAIALHHAVADGWSLGVLLRELALAYRAHRSGAPAALPALPIQYGDFAAWQRLWLDDDALAAEIDHWRQVLDGVPRVLDLPTDRPRPPVESHRGTGLPVALSAALSQGLAELSKDAGTTLFMTLLAGLQVVLSRWSGQRAFTVGTPVANRTRSELEPLIGFFVNTLVLPADLGGEPSFRDLLDRVRRTALDAYDHQDLPFERLVAALGAERDLSRAPLFQVMLAVHEAPLAGFELPGATVEPVAAQSDAALFDLHLALAPPAAPGEPIAGRLELAADLFDPATGERLLDHLARVLEAAVAEPEARVSALDLLGPSERAQIATAARGPELAPELEAEPGAAAFDAAFLVRRFEHRAAQRPDAPALDPRVDGSGGERRLTRLTYGELDRAADAWARDLAAAGVEPGHLVAVLMGRSADLVAAILGIWKLGAAYVPLDPAYPEERVRFMLEDSGARTVAVDPALAARLADLPAGVRPVLPPTADGTPSGDSPAPASPIPPDALSHVIYTSGSTGRPKGVMIPQRATAALAAWAERTFDDADRSAMVATTSICFDLSVFELFVTLALGGRVVLVAHALALAEPGAELDGASFVNTVPSALSEILRAGSLPASVRAVGLAGEPLGRPLADRVIESPGAPRLYNLYGPSEDTTYSTWSPVAAGPAEPAIGRPVDGTEAWVVDPASLELQPFGAVGELVLGGAGLARGYHGRPALTAERFVPDPFGATSARRAGARLYRTGDLVRWRTGDDGPELLFLGRLDQQVKIRGFRIEPGEVEAALLAHPGIARATVGAMASGAGEAGEAGETLLVAHLVPSGDVDAPIEPALGDWLAERLPAHLVPSAFVVLAELPHTPSGKVDRRALPRPDGSHLAARPERVAPRDETEARIAGFWSELLGIEQIGVHDDFFQLGGHSLMAVRLLARIRQETGVELPLQELFRNPTVAATAQAVERHRGQAGDRPTAPDRPIRRRRGGSLDDILAGARAQRHRPRPSPEEPVTTSDETP